MSALSSRVGWRDFCDCINHRTVDRLDVTRRSPGNTRPRLDHCTETFVPTDLRMDNIEESDEILQLPPYSDVGWVLPRCQQRWTPKIKYSSQSIQRRSKRMSQPHSYMIRSLTGQLAASNQPPKMQLADVWKSCRVATGRSVRCRTQRIPKITEAPKCFQSVYRRLRHGAIPVNS